MDLKAGEKEEHPAEEQNGPKGPEGSRGNTNGTLGWSAEGEVGRERSGGNGA